MAAPQTVSKPKPAAKLVVELDFDHDTKGALQFKEAPGPGGARPGVGTLYLTKEIVSKSGLGNYKKIKVTIEAVG